MPAAKTLKFTKTSIAAIKPPVDGERLVLRDSETPGLECRVTASGIKTFSVRRRVRGGAVERKTLGRFPEYTVDRAQREAKEVVADLAGGRSLASKARDKQTFGKLFDEYIKRHARPNKRTWEEDEAKYKKHLARPLGAKRLSAIARKDIASIHSQLTLNDQPTTANRVLALVSSVFGWARSAGLWEDNPVSGIKRNPEKSRDRFLQTDELPRFFASLAVEPNETLRDYLLVSLLTGARRADVLSMRWKDVSIDRAEWRIERTKNEDPQTVNLSLEAVEILKGRLELKKLKLKEDKDKKKDEPFVFPGEGKSGHLLEPIKGWRRVLGRASSLGYVRAVASAEGWINDAAKDADALALTDPKGALEFYATLGKKHGIKPDAFVLEDLRIHDLRRTLGSWQAKMGASLAIIGKSLNHRNVATTAIYARLDQDPVRQSVQGANSAILQAGGWKQEGTVVPIKKTP